MPPVRPDHIGCAASVRPDCVPVGQNPITCRFFETQNIDTRIIMGDIVDLGSLIVAGQHFEITNITDHSAVNIGIFKVVIILIRKHLTFD